MFVILAISLLLLPSCNQKEIPGITEPVYAKGVDLQFYKVSRIEELVLGDETIRAGSPYNILVRVDARTDYNNPLVVCEWPREDKIKISWIKNGERETIPWSVCQANPYKEPRVSYYFATFKDAKNFILVLPGGISVPLGSLGIR